MDGNAGIRKLASLRHTPTLLSQMVKSVAPSFRIFIGFLGFWNSAWKFFARLKDLIPRGHGTNFVFSCALLDRYATSSWPITHLDSLVNEVLPSRTRWLGIAFRKCQEECEVDPKEIYSNYRGQSIYFIPIARRASWFLSREREREAKLLPPRSVPHAHDN